MKHDYLEVLKSCSPKLKLIDEIQTQGFLCCQRGWVIRAAAWSTQEKNLARAYIQFVFSEMHSTQLISYT